MRDNDLYIRLALGSPCVGLGVWFVLSDPDRTIGMLGVFPCLLAFGLIVFPSVTAEAGNFLTQLILPHEDAAPRPHTSPAEALRFHGQTVEALAEYRRLASDFPHDLALWQACFEIAWTELGDRAVASEFHRLALRATADPGIRTRLSHLYRMQAGRHPQYAEWAAHEDEAIERRLQAAARFHEGRKRRRSARRTSAGAAKQSGASPAP